MEEIDFEIEIEKRKDNGLLFYIPLRENLKMKEGYGKINIYGDERFRIIKGKRCLLLEPKTINIFKGFDIPIEIKNDIEYFINFNGGVLDLECTWLDEGFEDIKTEILNPSESFFLPEGAKYLKIPPLNINNIHIQPFYKTEYTENKRKSNLLSIPTNGNINTKQGILDIEIYPLDIKRKQYLFIHNNVLYDTSTISFWIENHKIYRNDIRGITELNIELQSNDWNHLLLDYKGSHISNDKFYISDFIDSFNGYIRNIKIFNKG